MSDRVRIPARFNGPPESGHGGYSSGVIALALGEEPAAVSLRAPPPLETDLEVRPAADGIEVFAGETLIATAVPAAPAEDPPPFLAPADAAAVTTDPDELARWHPFPTCFGCGPAREPGDGLRLFAGAVPGRPGTFAADWTPDPELADADGTLPPEQVWAGLDCPGGAPAADGPQFETPVVLARLCVEIEGAVEAGRPHSIVGVNAGRDGRKRKTAMALFDETGKRLARGESLWIALR